MITPKGLRMLQVAKYAENSLRQHHILAVFKGSWAAEIVRFSLIMQGKIPFFFVLNVEIAPKA